MDKSVSIKIKEATHDVMDYQFLKNIGIEQIQKLSGKVWTDYNIHDPGITILENLCYVMTELGYRARHSVKDILAEKASSKLKMKDSLFDASKILSSKALTISDFRKILLDIEGIKNSVIRPSTVFPEFSGIYDIDIELHVDFNDEIAQAIIKKDIDLLLNMNRNLCEDFNTIKFVEQELIAFEIDIEIKQNIQVEEQLTHIYAELVQYLSPTITFHSLAELIEKGFKTEEIFNGPILKNGFVIDEELEELKIKEDLYTSDIVHLLMDVDDIAFIRKVSMKDNQDNIYKWSYKVETGKVPVFDFENSKIRIFNLGKEIKVDIDIKNNIDKIVRKGNIHSIHKKLDFDHKEGMYRDLSKYYSLQNEFPETYGIGELGLPPSVPISRKAQAKQLKSYLMFFEQIMANYFAQLHNINKLFSIEDVDNTYFTQTLFNISGIEYIYQPFINDCIKRNVDVDNSKEVKKEWDKFVKNEKEDFKKILFDIVENKEIFYDRRNRVLDHLLARFAFDYDVYRFDLENESDRQQKLINNKLSVLNEYINISKNRGLAFKNIFADKDDPQNISGLEYRLNLLLKIKHNSKKFPKNFYSSDFRLYSKISSSDLQKHEISENDFEIEFNNNIVYDSEKTFYYYATDENNFEVHKNEDKYKIFIYDNDRKNIAHLKKDFDSEQLSKDVIKKLTNKVKNISELSEAIHIIERILYRPNLKMKYFRFAILDNQAEPFFKYDEYFTFKERENLVDKILKLGTNRENFNIEINAINQFKIIIKDENNKQIIDSVKFYNSTQVAEEAIYAQIEFFKDLDEGIVNHKSVVTYYTKHYDLFHLADDPYSFITTILLPTWPKRFQNERFKIHVENTIIKEMPAHIAYDIKWVNIRNMTYALQLCEDYQTINRKHKPDYNKLSEISDKLFEFFIMH